VAPSGKGGILEPETIERLMDEEVAAFMVTNPNTLGLFETHIVEIAEIVHDRGGLVYCDGANMNAMLGVLKPGKMGVDVLHLNLHKTFTTPHGGGGPGAGPVAVRKSLEPFLPIPRIVQKEGRFHLDDDRPDSIGKLRAFYGNFGILVRAYTYIREMGPENLGRVAEMAVLNANYLLAHLEKHYHVPYPGRCMHECVLDDHRQKRFGVTTLDIAKRLIDLGFHPPTIYFPLIVHGALMIEPTETESKETLDLFIAAMKEIAREARENPEAVKEAPVKTRIGRLDEARAARHPILRWRPEKEEA
ncbi:MAG: aminotransferase class V-fold PLP-dependent enzyme, partial [Deltaproteobacteria bacterium]